MKMRKLLVLAMLVAMAGSASAARNFIVNGSFEASFVSTNSAGVTNGIYNGDPGNFAYGAVDGTMTIPSFVPGWDGEENWGYVWNPTGSAGTNHFGNYVGLTNVSHGAGAYGAAGGSGHFFRIWQLTNIRAEEGDTVILSWDINFLSADYSGGWFNAALQFVGEDQWVANFPYGTHGEPQDTWLTHSITQVVTAGEAGMPIQIQLNGAGVWVDDVRLEVIQASQPAEELLYNGSFELPFTDGYGRFYHPGTNNSQAYMSQHNGHFIPAWEVDVGGTDWGYVWNPTGSGGTNHWNAYVGLTNVSDGAGAAGAWGTPGHLLNTWQNTQTAVVGGDTVIFSWDMIFLSADYGANAWLNSHLQFVKWDTNGVPYAYEGSQIDIANNNTPFDVWRTHSITQIVTAAQSGAILQVHVQGSGAFIDNVSLKLFKTGGSYEGWISGYGLTGADADPDYDFEPDGVANFLEYAFGGDPTNPDATAIQPTYEFTAGTAEYVYRRRLDAATRGLDYDLFLNTNGLVLGSWDHLGSTFETNGVIDANFESVTNTIPVTGSQGFIKQEITEN